MTQIGRVYEDRFRAKPNWDKGPRNMPVFVKLNKELNKHPLYSMTREQFLF